MVSIGASHILIVAFAAIAMLASPTCASDLLMIFGTNAKGPGNGLSIAHFNTDTGALTNPTFAIESALPTYFAIAHDGRHLYAINEVDHFQGQHSGAISAFSIDASGAMALINQQPTGSPGPAFVSLDATGHLALVANYGGGAVCVFVINPDGSLGNRTAFIQHTGHGPDPDRQSKPHPHSIWMDPTNRFALVPDLGLDKVFIYQIDATTGTVLFGDGQSGAVPPTGQNVTATYRYGNSNYGEVPPGSGPRHLSFHPNGHWVYVLNEMGGSVSFFHWDSLHGAMTIQQTISALPRDYKGHNTSADIAVHPNGKFLYATDRGPDCLAVFSIGPDGYLTFVQTVPTGGKTPRNFTIDPTGRWIIVSNQDGNNVVVFRIDPQTGCLTQVGQPMALPNPMCDRFVPDR